MSQLLPNLTLNSEDLPLRRTQLASADASGLVIMKLVLQMLKTMQNGSAAVTVRNCHRQSEKSSFEFMGEKKKKKKQTENPQEQAVRASHFFF